MSSEHNWAEQCCLLHRTAKAGSEASDQWTRTLRCFENLRQTKEISGCSVHEAHRTGFLIRGYVERNANLVHLESGRMVEVSKKVIPVRKCSATRAKIIKVWKLEASEGGAGAAGAADRKRDKLWAGTGRATSQTSLYPQVSKAGEA